MLHDTSSAESSAAVAQRVERARDRTASRLLGTPWRVNADVPGAELRRSFALQPRALAELDHAMEIGLVSARGADKIVRIAWTIADLEARPRPTRDIVNEALGLWTGARP
jgi:magnesium chelatase family protein